MTLGGRVTEIRRIMTKKGDAMLAVQLEDLQGSHRGGRLPQDVRRDARDVWREDAVLLVTGTVKMRDDEPQLVCESVEEFVATEEEVNRREYLVRIRLQRSKNSHRSTSRSVTTA